MKIKLVNEKHANQGVKSHNLMLAASALFGFAAMLTFAEQAAHAQQAAVSQRSIYLEIIEDAGAVAKYGRQVATEMTNASLPRCQEALKLAREAVKLQDDHLATKKPWSQSEIELEADLFDDKLHPNITFFENLGTGAGVLLVANAHELKNCGAQLRNTVVGRAWSTHERSLTSRD